MVTKKPRIDAGERGHHAMEQQPLLCSSGADGGSFARAIAGRIGTLLRLFERLDYDNTGEVTLANLDVWITDVRARARRVCDPRGVPRTHAVAPGRARGCAGACTRRSTGCRTSCGGFDSRTTFDLI
jgi:hypothetical protein